MQKNQDNWWSTRSISTRLGLSVSGIMLVAVASLSGLAVTQMSSLAERTTQREMTESLALIETALESVYDGAINRGQEMMPKYIEALGGLPKVTGNTIDFMGVQNMPEITDTYGNMLNGNTDVESNLQNLSGASGAIFVKKGAQWIRASTLLTDDQGKSMMGTAVDPGDSLYHALSRDKQSSEIVLRNNRYQVITVLPLLDEQGNHYAGLSVRVDVDHSVRTLLKEMTEGPVAAHAVAGVLQKQANSWVYSAGPRSGQEASAEVKAFMKEYGATERGFVSYNLGAGRGDVFIAWTNLPQWNWTLYVSGSEDDFLAEGLEAALALCLTLIIAGGLITFACALIAKKTLDPVKNVVASMSKIGEGDLTQEIPRAPEHSSSEVHQLLNGLAMTQAGLRETVAEVIQSVNEIRSGSSEISSGNDDLAARTEQQAASLEQTAASMQEISSTIENTAQNAMQAKELTEAASNKADHGGKAMLEVVATMQDISQGSSRIADIVSVIDSIAFQTNILALNAAVEAARAGEQGKGFAVVASEVRTLAQRSASAAKEIKDLIGHSVEMVQDGATKVDVTRRVIEDLVQSVKNTSALMGEISSATAEQSIGVGQVNEAIGQMDGVTAQNAALVTQAAAASRSLEDQANRLATVVSRFKV